MNGIIHDLFLKTYTFSFRLSLFIPELLGMLMFIRNPNFFILLLSHCFLVFILHFGAINRIYWLVICFASLDNRNMFPNHRKSLLSYKTKDKNRYAYKWQVESGKWQKKIAIYDKYLFFVLKFVWLTFSICLELVWRLLFNF